MLSICAALLYSGRQDALEHARDLVQPAAGDRP
jgi:hypothetical protein